MEHKFGNKFIFLAMAAASIGMAFLAIRTSLLGVFLFGLAIIIVIVYLSIAKPLCVAIMMMFSALLLPPLTISSNLPAIRPEFFIVIIMFYSMLFSNKKLLLYKNPLNKWFLFFGLCILLSILYGGVRGYSIGVRDFYEIMKLTLYWMMFYVGLQVIRKTKDTDGIIKYLLIFFLLTSILGIGQFFNLGNINSWLSPYYTNVEKYGMINEYGRIVGTTGNPNEFGILLTIGSLLALSFILMDYSHKKLLYIVLALTSLGVLFTGSRTALVGLIIGVVLLIFYYYPRYSIKKKSIGKTTMIFFTLISIVIVVISLAPDIFFKRSQDLYNISGDASWTYRLKMWKGALEIWWESPIIGFGPSKGLFVEAVDNEWILLLRSYGIIGVTFFIGLFFNLFQQLSLVAKQLSSNSSRAYIIVLQALLIVFAINMIPAQVYAAMQIMPFYFLCAGIGISLGKFTRS